MNKDRIWNYLIPIVILGASCAIGMIKYFDDVALFQIYFTLTGVCWMLWIISGKDN